MYKISICLIVLLVPTLLLGQVGVNTPNPESSSILELKDSERGFLPPRMTRLQRENMTNQHGVLPAGLIVYDTDDQMYYFYNPVNGDGNNAGGDENWQALAPINYKDNKSDFQSPNYMRTIETHRSVKNVYLFSNTANTLARRLHVKGSVSISETNVNPTGNYGLYVQDNATFNAPVTVNGTVTASGYVGAGTVPLGTIVMWSGSPNALPQGWQLCNGSGSFTNAVGATTSVPDLRGKFIVSYDPSNTDYNALGKTGGSKDVALSLSEMPSHTHGVSLTSSSAGDHRHRIATACGSCGSSPGATSAHNTSNGVAVDGNGSSGTDWDIKVEHVQSTGAHTHTVSGATGTAGTGTAHENRPPYYVLAFIIRTF